MDLIALLMAYGLEQFRVNVIDLSDRFVSHGEEFAFGSFFLGLLCPGRIVDKVFRKSLKSACKILKTAVPVSKETTLLFMAESA